MNVLIVEDDADTCALLEIAFGGRGHQVTYCGDGEQALALCPDPLRQFEAVLMDLHMPRLGGLSAAKSLRQGPATRDMAIVCYSAYADMIADTADRELFDWIVTKPTSPRQVVRRVEEAASRRRVGRAS